MTENTGEVVISETPKLFSDAAANKNDEVNSSPDADVNLDFLPEFNVDSPEALKEFFELDKVVSWITANGYKKVAIQLPDAYLTYAFEISQFLEAGCAQAKVYILGDTSYRNCCVDEVGAEHINSDSLIHFGDACLSTASGRLPLLYIFCKFRLNIDNFRIELKRILREITSIDNVALVYDTALIPDAVALAESVADVLPSTTNFAACHVNEIGKASCSDFASSSHLFGRDIPGCVAEWEPGAALIFVGSENSPLLPLWLMTFVQFSEVLQYSSRQKKMSRFPSLSSRQLRKRLFLVEKLRDANTVGLVIGTLAVKGYREAIARVRALCKTAKKKLYVFSIGKLNEAKLSNFAGDIDVFILLSCPFGIVLSNEFYKSIVSLFEAEIALNPARNWFAEGGWTAQFSLKALADEIGKLEEDETDVSLITGKMRYTKAETEGEDVSRNERKQIIQYSAGDYFANRTWKGLDDEHLEQDGNTTVKAGLSGIAANYASETGTIQIFTLFKNAGFVKANITKLE